MEQNHTIAASTSAGPVTILNICSDVEEEIQSCKTPVSGSDGPSAELPPQNSCCECSNDPVENAVQR